MTQRKPDIGHRETDEELVKLLKRLHDSYMAAISELQQKIDDYMEQFEKQDAQKRALYDTGELSHEEFLKWRQSAIIETKQ